MQIVDKNKKQYDLKKKVQDCLKQYDGKIFIYQEKTQKWSLNIEANYFESLEKKLKKKNESLKIVPKKRDALTYEQIL